jgi:hypothetical protein
MSYIDGLLELLAIICKVVIPFWAFELGLKTVVIDFWVLIFKDSQFPIHHYQFPISNLRKSFCGAKTFA